VALHRARKRHLVDAHGRASVAGAPWPCRLM
jgi:hypothetical protein